MTTDSVAFPAGQEAEAKSRRRTKAPKAPRTRHQTWKGFGLSLLLLVGFFAIAAGVLVLGGVVLHHLVPSQHVDAFASLHNDIVVAVLLGLVALWLLPPYPLMRTQPSSESRGPVQSIGGMEVGALSSSTDLSQYRAGSHLTGRRVSERRGAEGSR